MPPIKKPAGDRPLTAVGAYIFAGGFTVGVKKHFEVLGHLEGSNYGVAVAARNFPGMPISVGAGNWPLNQLKTGGEIDFVYGNPPCAAWSGNNPASHRTDGTGWEVDPRVDCTRTHFKLIDTLRPKVWAWESVWQAAVKGKPLVDKLTRDAAALGYSTTYLFHDAQYLGVPQTRKRWFMICHRVECPFPPPPFKSLSAADVLKKVTPRGGPASDTGRLEVIFEKWFHKIPAGTRLRAFWEKYVCPPEKQVLKPNGHVKGRIGFGHIRLPATGPATATVGYSMMHPTEPRFTTLNEVQAIAGFPQSFDFGGKPTYAKELDLIARGVCPPVGEWLARHAAAACRANIPVKTPTVTVVDYRVPGVPPRDVTAEVLGGGRANDQEAGSPGGAQAVSLPRGGPRGFKRG